MAGWGMFAGYGAKILDKLIPSRLERLRNELEDLTKAYGKALGRNDDMRAAELDKRLRELRTRLGGSN